MFKLRKLNKITDFFRNLPKSLAENAFLVFLVFIFLSLILGSLVFYRYSFLIEKRESEITEQHIIFNEKTLQEILRIWQEKEKKFKETEFKKYPNPFDHSQDGIVDEMQ